MSPLGSISKLQSWVSLSAAPDNKHEGGAGRMP